MKPILSLLLFISAVASSQTVYIVRHAEKAAQAPNMSSDVPLSEAGVKRAEELKNLLLKKKIVYIFSTDKIRTKSTAKPLSDALGIPVQLYSNDTMPKFIERVKALKANVLIVGHSNTIDDLANALAGEKKVQGDFADTDYDNLLIVKFKKKKILFEHKTYGAETN
ncbi:MAG: histidine phosphatase family protein [Sphingobacteriales bacterium]|nr:histidine phosphatase family protein [Sphingobacteriales bacterium]MBI3719284.1 histidine phosphatase family protein [Sphingobacteriales bacterium]